MHPKIRILLQCIDWEEKEQVNRYSLDQHHTLRALKSEGLALHPISVTRKTFGYADYPEISFRLPYPAETGQFRDGTSIECFSSGEEPVKGVMLSMEGKGGEFRLFAPDYPDWIEDDGVGIKLAPDTRTTGIMKKVLEQLEERKEVFHLFQQLHGDLTVPPEIGIPSKSQINFSNSKLNQSQQDAVRAILDNETLVIVHGPPGTGKTTTLVEAVWQLVKAGEKVLVSAPSNTAVDHISKEILRKDIRLLRVGNASKADEMVFAHTPEGRLSGSREQKDIRQLKKRAEEFRRMAMKYKRSFGKAEREQRSLLFKEVKNIRNEIKQLEKYHEEKLFSEAQVIAGTPVGLYDAGITKMKFTTLVIDEAGQCIEPLAWCIIPMADKLVLAGDHWQLPPTVLSQEALRGGLNRSILELAVATAPVIHLLNVQYRMRTSIAGFSSAYFYDNLLHTATHLQDTGVHVFFIDTAGSGFQEERGPDGTSLQNPGEVNVVRALLEQEKLDLAHTALISPYAGQVTAAREIFPQNMRISTVDSFQGQEQENIIVSLVRSNEDGDIGFLRDYRRMNVAMTRARERLYVIGDSATLGADPFFDAFLQYVDRHGAYQTAWDFALE